MSLSWRSLDIAKADKTDDETNSIARTFGVRSRADNSLRQHSSIDSSIRQTVPIPASPSSNPTALAPAIPPKSPSRSISFDEYNQAGPSTRPRPQSMFISTSAERVESSGYAGTFNAHSESHESDTPRSVTPASSFYAKPKRKMGQVKSRGSSLLDLNAVNGDDTYTPPPRSSIPRSSDEGFDSSHSHSTGSNSLRSHMSVPVDANLRSMPGVVGIGEGWAGGPQGQDKKRRLWFRRKSSKKPADDPLALWSIQESDPMASPNGKGAKKRVFKDAWNRSIGKFGSTPALLSGEQVNTGSGSRSGGGIKTFFSRSRVDLVDENDIKRPVDPQAQAKKEKRRTIAFFGSSKSQVELSTPRARPMSTVLAPTPHSPSPPSPSPAPRLSNPSGISRDATPLAPINVPDHSRRLSAPLSAPAAPGGLPPPWRPLSFAIPRPLGSPAPRSFSRHDDRALSEEPEEVIQDQDNIPSLSNTPGIDGLQNSISSSGMQTPRTNSAEGRSLRHKRSTRMLETDESDMETPRPKSSLARSTTPYTTTPLNDSTPGLDTIHSWAYEGKRPISRAFRPAQDAPPKFPERSQTPTWAPPSFMSRIKQAFNIPTNDSYRRGKDLPELPSGTSTPVMPGAYPNSRPVSSIGMRKDDPLPPSPYDITKAVAMEMLATPSPTRPSSRASVRKRGLSADLFPRLTKIREAGDSGDGDYTRPTSRLEKRNSYATLAGRFGFGRRGSFGPEQSLSVSTTDFARGQNGVEPVSPSPITPLTVRDFGEQELGLDDILDATRRMTLVRDLEAALPLPPARDEPVSPETIASSPKTVSSSEATVMGSSPHATEEDKGHRNHPSTSTAATFDLDELMTPADIRKSFEKSVGGRRGSQQSDRLSFDAEGNIVDTSSRRHWPTRKHTRNTSIGERASELFNVNFNKSRTSVQEYCGNKRGSIVEGDPEEDARIREREQRALSFASQISDMSSAMSLDEEEAGESFVKWLDETDG